MYFDKHRNRMVEQLAEKGIVDKGVLDAMRKIPRHEFVPSGLEFQAYDEKALPIGFGQTISHPYTVAMMTEALAIKNGEKVLEVGTGSGYQTAILCEMKARVFTIEINSKLVLKAKGILNRLGYHYLIYNGDGSQGWPSYAPYDSIIVTAGTPVIPEELLEQLNESGRLIIPLGRKDEQKLILFEKNKNKIEKTILGNIQFVPLNRKGESKK
jgi:protein-L-isoaspartate(D-aspartate) O-methyltransferase